MAHFTILQLKAWYLYVGQETLCAEGYKCFVVNPETGQNKSRELVDVYYCRDKTFKLRVPQPPLSPSRLKNQAFERKMFLVNSLSTGWQNFLHRKCLFGY